MDRPELSPTDRLSPNCYVPPVTHASAKADFAVPFSTPVDISPLAASSDVPAPPSPLAQVKVEHIGRLFTSRIRQEHLANPHLCPALGHMNPAAAPMKPFSLSSAKNAHAKTEAEDEVSSPRFLSARDNFFAELANVSTDRQPSLLRADQAIAIPGSNFTICCNHCDAAIPNAHWHCSSCDNGDFDLCTDCVNKGVLCDSKDHWLIKRFVQNGKVTNSTTERIEPKKAPTIETVVAKEAPGANPPDCKKEVSHEGLAESRTCNSCVTGTTRNLHLCTNLTPRSVP